MKRSQIQFFSQFGHDKYGALRLTHIESSSNLELSRPIPYHYFKGNTVSPKTALNVGQDQGKSEEAHNEAKMCLAERQLLFLFDTTIHSKRMISRNHFLLFDALSDLGA